jgi:hypothetical protein
MDESDGKLLQLCGLTVSRHVYDMTAGRYGARASRELGAEIDPA